MRQLRGLGINLNQLAHAANEGRPVVVPQKLLDEIDARIRESRLLLPALALNVLLAGVRVGKPQLHRLRPAPRRQPGAGHLL